MTIPYLEAKYAVLLSYRLRNFKRSSAGLFNFSCPLCGDSQSDRRKARGWIYEKNGSTYYHCHRCGQSRTFSKFLRELDEQLYSQMVMEQYSDKRRTEDEDLYSKFSASGKETEKRFAETGFLSRLVPVSKLSKEDPVRELVERRRLPVRLWGDLYSCPNYMRFTNLLLPKKFTDRALEYDETRLLIPLRDRDGIPFGYQTRSLDGVSLCKYVTIVLNEGTDRLYGLDRLGSGKAYLFEGPIDSMFIPNGLATCGGDMVAAMHRVGSIDPESVVLVYDNEPRSSQTVKKILKGIDSGYSVCVWPESFAYKDVNDAVIAGLTGDEVFYTIKENTFKGLAARTALISRKRVGLEDEGRYK